MGILQDDDVGDVGAVPTCERCGSERVVKDAWACWNSESGIWEIETVFDHEFCQACDAETTFKWKRCELPPVERIRALNDEWRIHGRGSGSVVVTSGIQALGDEFILMALSAVRSFDAFTDDNDPWGEHDFGALDVGGEKIFWKIDPYDLSLTQRSPNPGNPAVTHRVFTIMLASEY